MKISKEKATLQEVTHSQETFHTKLCNPTILSCKDTQEVSLWQQERESATKIVILYRDSYFCVTGASIVAVLVSIYIVLSAVT